ncbi:MAG: cytochrome c [Pseudomonadota bacterium]
MERRLRYLAAAFAALAVSVPGWMAPAAGPDRVVAYTIVDARSIPDSLTGIPGNPESGRQLYFDRQLTNCSGCHGSPGGPGAEADPQDSGAPNLAGLASRMQPGTARLWLVAPMVLERATAMPGYYAIGQRRDPQDPRFGEPVLSAQEIEDVLAYLMRQSAE